MEEQIRHVAVAYGLQSFLDGTEITPSRLIKKVNNGADFQVSLEINLEFDL